MNDRLRSFRSVENEMKMVVKFVCKHMLIRCIGLKKKKGARLKLNYTREEGLYA